MSAIHPGKIELTYESFLNPNTQITFDQLQHFIHNKIILGILAGTKIGAAGLMLVILWMVSKNRRTPIFIINQVTLLLFVLHSILYIRNLLGHFSSATFHFTLFEHYITQSDKQLYAATNVLQVLIVACIEISMIFQVRVIFRTDNYKRIGTIFTTISAILGISTVVMYFVTALNGILDVFEDVLKVSNTRYYNVSTILLASSVNFMTLLLSIKLFLAIRSRRFLGLKQFDSFHILLIMSGQTLIGPSILFVLAYSLKSRGTDSLTTIAMLLVALSLPLSSMWATSKNDSSQPTSLNTQFAPHSDAASFRTANTTYYEHSLKSKSWRAQKSQDFYPPKRTGTSSDSGEDNTIVDVEKNAFHLDNINQRSYTIRENVIHFERENKCTAISINDDEKVQTPTTAADEEARAFWSGVSLEGSSAQRQEDGHIEFSSHI